MSLRLKVGLTKALRCVRRKACHHLAHSGVVGKHLTRNRHGKSLRLCPSFAETVCRALMTQLNGQTSCSSAMMLQCILYYTPRNENGFSARQTNILRPMDFLLYEDWFKLSKLRLLGTRAVCFKKAEFSQL